MSELGSLLFFGGGAGFRSFRGSKQLYFSLKFENSTFYFQKKWAQVKTGLHTHKVILFNDI